MDLHDYKDVAENYDRYLDVMYSQGQDNHEGFQEFYLNAEVLAVLQTVTGLTNR